MKVATGRTEKEFLLSACSEGRITESEFADFQSTLADEGLRFPTRRLTSAKLADIHALLNHQWSEADIQGKMEKMQASRKAYIEFHRSRITRRRDDALARGDDVTAARCNKDLADLNLGNVVGGASAASKNRVAIKKEDQQSRLAALNKSNRKTNSEEIRKALVAETVARQKARAAAIARAKEEEERERSQNGNGAAEATGGGLQVPSMGDDLFGDGSDISRAASPANGTPATGRSRASTPLPGGGLKEKKSFGQFSKKKMDDEVIAAMDLEIDIDV